MNRKISKTIHQMQSKKDRSYGFSLVEILVILAIISILAVISGTALMKWIPQANLKRGARTIVSMAQFARVEAIKRNENVSLNCTGNTCLVTLPSDNTQLRKFDLTTLQSGIQLNNAFSTVFTNRGRLPYGDPGGSIIIQNNAANTLTIEVQPSGSIVTK
jgi:prepilin-type N-terminal cleavage/methylation domain-containing protein